MKDMLTVLNIFKNSAHMSSPSAAHHHHHLQAHNLAAGVAYNSPMGGMAAMGGGYGGSPYYGGGGGINDPYEMPERDPDVWPPPPPINKNNFAYRPPAPPNLMNNNIGYNNMYPSPKHRDYKGKQVSGGDKASSKQAGKPGAPQANGGGVPRRVSNDRRSNQAVILFFISNT